MPKQTSDFIQTILALPPLPAEENDDLVTPAQALKFLFDLAWAEAERLRLAAKLYASHGSECPVDVRKKARRHHQILDAIKILQEMEK